MLTFVSFVYQLVPVNDKITDNSVCVKDDIAVLRKKLSTIEKDMKECRLRYASGKIDDETFSIAIQEFEERKGEILLGIEKYETELSNSQMQ